MPLNPEKRTALRRRLSDDMAQSPLAASLRSLALTREKFSAGRAPTVAEIARLEAQGNTCEDWSRIHFTGEGDWGRIRDSHFAGMALVALPAGFVLDHRGRAWNRGIRRAWVENCLIGHAAIDNVGRLENQVVEDDVVLAHAGLVTCSPGQRFGLGQKIHVGDESGSRSLWFWDGLDVETCQACLHLDPAGQKDFQAHVDACLKGLSSDFGRIGRGSVILATRSLQDTWVGEGARICGASHITGCALLSEAAAPCRLGSDVRLANSFLQAAAEVDGAGSVYRSLLLAASSVGESGKVSESVLGANTQVAKGEVTASLVGPFVGFHHQALLIAALWPEGRGNVAYGANVGSNHTGKKPDQEIVPGEGMFFGLGCSVKFPAHFGDAPYSLIASGVITLPQRVTYPFALILQGNLPATEAAQGLNEIRPGFLWSENLYALARNSFKYRDRDKSPRKDSRIDPQGFADGLGGAVVKDGFFGGRLFDPPMITRVAKAYGHLAQALQADSAQAADKARTRTGDGARAGSGDGAAPGILLAEALPGLGKNYLRRDYLRKAHAAYAHYLKLALLRWAAEPALRNDAALHGLCCGPALRALGFPDEQIGTGIGAWQAEVASWLPLLRDLPKAVGRSLERDDKRGADIMDDYAAFHGKAEGDAVVIRVQESVAALEAKWGEMG